jgi:hypothetical protein
MGKLNFKIKYHRNSTTNQFADAKLDVFENSLTEFGIDI